MPMIASNPVARIKSRIMHTLSVVAAFLILVLLALVTGYLVYLGARAVNLAFFTKVAIAENVPGYPGGMMHGLIGTVILVALAALVGVPMGVLCGIYLSEYSANSFLGGPVRFICDVLTGVPSIVVGILGYELIVQPMSNHYSGWAGAAALAFIMVPIIARTTEEMLRLVPNSYREASIALGATQARTILRVIVPSAKGSLITGMMLAIARVAGETAPLLFTALGSNMLQLNPNKPFPSLTKEIYNATQAGLDSPEAKKAWAGILVLMSLIFVLNVAVRVFTRAKPQVA